MNEEEVKLADEYIELMRERHKLKRKVAHIEDRMDLLRSKIEKFIEEVGE